MKKIIVLLFAILSFMTLKAADPDFAHPKTTLDAAIKHYESAISSPATSTSGLTMIKSLLEIIGATAAIDQDSLVRVIPRIDRAIDAYSGADKALMLTVKAELLNSIYSAKRWTYDRMETPDEPLPEDITEWNGRQFTAQIQSVLTDAFNLAAENKSVKLADYKSVIEGDRTTFIYFPSVASFVALKALNKNFNDNSDYSKDIINRMVSLSPEKSAPWFYWMVAKELAENITMSDEYDDEDDDDENELATLRNLFLENSDCEQAGIVLTHLAEYYPNYDQAPKWLIPSLKDFINRYPDYWQINELKNALNRLTCSVVKLNINKIVSPNKPITIKVSQYFASNFGVNIYKITESEFDRNNIKLQSKTPYKTLTVKNKTNIERADTTLTFDIDSPGYYVAIPVINGSMSNASKAFFICSAYYPILVSSINPNAFIITDLTNGSPIKGIAVTESNPHPELLFKSSRLLGKSNREGVLKFDEVVATKENRWQNLEYTFSDGRTALKFPNLTSFINWKSDTKDRDEYLAELMLDREIYHPGDTVNWAAIVTVGPQVGERRTAENVKMHLEFENANSQTVDSINVVTDALGRAYGSFIAPESGLTGKYTIRIRTYEPPFDWIATQRVTISDFKLPTFKISDLSVSRDKPVKGEVTLTGNAMTFSGMPVVGAKVEAEVWQASRWRWFSPSRKLGLLQASTDDKGHFTIIVTDSLLNEANNQCFVAKFTVTSLSGEACTESKSFTTGKPYFINITSHDLVNSDEPLIEPFEVYDADGNIVDIDLHWWLSTDDDNFSPKDAIASGVCHTSKGYSIDLSNIPSDIYYLYAAPVDSSLANRTAQPERLTVYSLAKNTLPDNKPFLLPDMKCITDKDGKVKITVGCAKDDSYIYMVTGVGNQLRSIEPLHLDRGFHKLSFALRDNEQNAKLCFIAVRKGKVTEEMIEIERPDTRKLSLEGSAMRDKLSPGECERWTLKLTDFLKEGVEGGLIATMFNAALNSIEHYSLPYYLYFNYPSASINIRYTNNYIQVASVSKKLTTVKQSTLLLPEFNPSINYSALVGTRMRIRGTMSKAMYDDAVEVEGIAYASDFASPLANHVAGLAVTSGESFAEYEEEADEEELYELVADDAYPAGAQLAAKQDFDYRDSEVLQAFWMPELTFNPQGEAEISFTVPNANTTWAFNAFAWTADVRSAKMVREFVASKPVMVQPNLPRFLRAGDKARVLATVYNNSDSAAAITTVVEIFDITSGAVKSQFTSTDSVDAKASAIVGATVIADGDVSAIGYRVRSTLDRFTDGEQSFIPVIAATSDVIESENFYLNPGDATVEVKVPDGKNMKSTLDYTANPAWNIIKELPGLAAENSSTSVGASLQLFGAATAAGLLRNYPALAEVLKAWSEDPDSKALTSRLAQNDELKAAVLNSTPWVQAAAGDTERMVRLSLLFDRKTTDKSIQTSIATLKKLQQADGGWSWGSWGKQSSLWSTNIVLQNLARLNDIGYLPTDNGLKQMISRAIAYYESEIPKKELIDYAFTYIVSMFPDVEIGLRGKQVVNATVQDIIGNWQKSSTWYKAIEAIILDRNEHKAVAGQIIGSLSEFAVTSADKGTSFPSISNVNDYTDLLYAFSSITPDSKIIDGMRQWLVLRQQTTEQLGSIDPTRLIAAFAASGSNWFGANDDTTTFAINGSTLNIGDGELATGHIVYNLPSTAGGKKLSIDRGNAAGVPAYGSVISRYTTESSKVKAQSCSDLSVEKRITALRDGNWQYVDDVQLGEQVRVLLTIKVKRDLEYVTVIDEHPAAFEPVDQLPGWVWNGGAGFYRENRDSATNLFIDYLPKGTYQITIDMTASVAGDFTTGIATVQSQLAPSITAHSAGSVLHCK